MTIHTLTIQPASSVPREQLVEALNTAYADYFVPIRLSLHDFDYMAGREDIDLAGSAVALDGDQIVGMGLLGVRGKRAYIGGMGVIPDYRHRGTGRRLMHFLLDQARLRRLESVVLEVIVENDPAYHLYHSLGFSKMRRLFVMTRAADAFPVQPLPGDLRCDDHPLEQAIGALEKLPGASRPWQRQSESCRNFPDLFDAFAAFDSGGEVAGVLIHSGSLNRIGLTDCAARSPEIGRALLAHLVKAYPDAHLSYLNVTEDDPLLPLLRECGFIDAITQYEMIIHLNEERP